MNELNQKRNENKNETVTLIAGDKCWIEHTALKQLETVSILPGVRRTVGLPDLHAGKGPVGIAVETEDRLYPHLIGGDIGCGMSLFETNCSQRKYKEHKFQNRLNHIRVLSDLAAQLPIDESCPIPDFGTLGGGNHFAEFQKLEQVYDEETMMRTGLRKDRILLLIHSGSRNYGQQIFNRYGALKGLDPQSADGAAYLKAHDNAVHWAERNRRAAAEILMDHLGYCSGLNLISGCCHNYIEKQSDNSYIHRKGTVGTNQDLLIIPGSRGSLTYIVKPAADTSLSLFSLSHGAGRKWARSLCKGRIGNKYDRNTIRRTELGSTVVCHDTELLFQEAPEAYKNIRHIIDALVGHELCTVVATLRPLLTYKG